MVEIRFLTPPREKKEEDKKRATSNKINIIDYTASSIPSLPPVLMWAGVYFFLSPERRKKKNKDCLTTVFIHIKMKSKINRT